MGIRLAQPGDAPALLEIYAKYMDTPVTFEVILPSLSEFAARMAAIAAVYPYLVWEEDGRITGYACAHRQMERAAYQWNAELSIYLDHGVQSRGLGRRLSVVLLELLRAQGVRNVYSLVTVPNAKSEKLHLRLGFSRAGILRHAGFKCGAWHDVCWFEKQLAPCGTEPEPILPLSRLPRETIQKILQKDADKD